MIDPRSARSSASRASKWGSVVPAVASHPTGGSTDRRHVATPAFLSRP